MASERLKYPVHRCARCRQPTISGMNRDGLCKPCTEKAARAREIKLHGRMLEFLRARKHDLDWTGFDDLRRAVCGEPEPKPGPKPEAEIEA